jgi:cytochrome c553
MLRIEARTAGRGIAPQPDIAASRCSSAGGVCRRFARVPLFRKSYWLPDIEDIMLNVIWVVVLIATAAILVRITIWASRTRGTFLKWAGVGSGVVATVIFAATASVMTTGLYRLNERSAPVPDLKVAGTPEQIQRGEAIADSFCGACHSKTGTLTGGVDMGKKLPIDIGSFVSSNLTPAGSLKHWSDGQIFRAIRNGVDANGHRLFIMSLTSAGNLSDDDIQSLIAYIRMTPAAGAQTPEPPDDVNALGVAMLGAGLIPSGKTVSARVITAPTKGATAQYGQYIISYLDCRQCHGNDLTGGQGGIVPVGPDLTLVKDWTRAEFITTMRTGTDPNGHEMVGDMPWRNIGKMDDVELGALYEYLVLLPSAPETIANQRKAAR